MKGIALVLVLIIISVLSLVATPFVLSMMLGEKEGYAISRNTMAEMALDSTRNFAITQLYATNDLYERIRNGTPYYDTPAELTVDLRGSPLATIFNKKNILTGINIADEQGKINLLTAPQTLINNLKSQLDPRVQDIRDFTTLYSVRESHWVYPQNIRGFDRSGNIIVDNASHFGSGAHLKITKTGLNNLEGVTAVWTQSGFTTNLPISRGYINGLIEVEARHPINVNTASLQVLAALFQGISTTKTVQVGKQTRIIQYNLTYNDAARIAMALYNRQFTSISNVANAIYQVNLCGVDLTNVVLNTKDPNNVALNGTGTMPLCVKSYDVFTLAPICSINSPLGEELAQKSYREVTQISPADTLTWKLESQYDFEQNLGGNTNLPGYPFGNRVVTFPQNISSGAIADTALKPNNAYIQLTPSRDTRGYNIYNFDHFDNTVEGTQLGANGLAKNWSYALQTRGGQNDVNAGGIEFWIRFDSPLANNSYFFDIREGEFQDRLSLNYFNGQLILTACDATLEQQSAQVKMPFTPTINTWYHIGSYWKGTSYADLALLVDGFAHPSEKFSHVDSQGREIMTTLAQDLTNDPKDKNFSKITLTNPGAFPSGGVIKVGSEVIDCSAGFNNVIRGARGTIPLAHPQDAVATLFGYSNPLATQQIGGGTIDRITTGGATLADTVQAFVPIMQIYNDGKGTSITDTIIKVDNKGGYTVNDFPVTGYILINNSEVVYYGGKVPGKQYDEFTGCQRGQLGTTATAHMGGEPVELFSIKISDNTNYLNPAIIQLDDEWIGPIQKAGTNYFTAVINNGRPRSLSSARGFNSMAASHNAGVQIIPVFPVLNSILCGKGDVVTILASDNSKEEQTIRNAGGGYAAFFNNVSKEYIADGVTRLLKFPSGELISLTWLNKQNPQFLIGSSPNGIGISGTIDEMRTFAMPKIPVVMTNQIDTMATTVNTTGPINNVGAIKVGDEIIGYPNYDYNLATYTLNNVKRGYLNSTTAIHDAGGEVFPLNFLSISALNAGIANSDASIPLTSPVTQPEGYLFIGNEAIGFTSGGSNPSMPPRKDGSGLFRGAFGTVAQSHSQNDLAYEIPFRFWDTYKPQEFDDKMAYYQASYSIPDAYWQRVWWNQDIPTNDGNLGVVALARIGGQGDWTEAPSQNIYQFNGSAGNSINRYADSIELLFLFKYKSGSFYPADSWKRSPKITQIGVDYARETKTLYHSE